MHQASVDEMPAASTSNVCLQRQVAAHYNGVDAVIYTHRMLCSTRTVCVDAVFYTHRLRRCCVLHASFASMLCSTRTVCVDAVFYTHLLRRCCVLHAPFALACLLAATRDWIPSTRYFSTAAVYCAPLCSTHSVQFSLFHSLCSTYMPQYVKRTRPQV